VDAEHRLRAAPDLSGERLLVAAPLYHMNALWITCVVAFPGHASVGHAAALLGARLHRGDRTSSLHLAHRRADHDGAGGPGAGALAATDCSSVQRITIGSAPLTQALIDRIKPPSRAPA
jgi:hypothetical protein